jgi:glycosyltransferase involved in cell wall biosynthesis
MLHAADVMVQCSLEEGFGRVLTEAMGAGTPVLTHPYQTARWIVDNPDCLVDMTIEGQLSMRLDRLMKYPGLRKTISERNLVLFQRFEWKALVPEYLKMYHQACALDGVRV